MSTPYNPQAVSAADTAGGYHLDADLNDTKEDAVISARQQFTYSDAKRLKRKADLRILPLLMMGYLV